MAILYGIPLSPFVRKTMLAHAHKGLDFELQTTAPGSDDPAFRQASPLGKIPAYRTQDGAFADSSVIVAYLERTSDHNKLYPENASDYGKALWLEEFADTDLTQATAGLYFQLVLGPKFFQHQTDEERVSELTQTLIPKALTMAESQLAGNQYFVGDAFSIADLVIGGALMSLEHAKFDLDESLWPNLKAFYQAFSAMDIVQAQFKTERGMLSS